MRGSADTGQMGTSAHTEFNSGAVGGRKPAAGAQAQNVGRGQKAGKAGQKKTPSSFQPLAAFENVRKESFRKTEEGPADREGSPHPSAIRADTFPQGKVKGTRVPQEPKEKPTGRTARPILESSGQRVNRLKLEAQNKREAAVQMGGESAAARSLTQEADELAEEAGKKANLRGAMENKRYHARRLADRDFYETMARRENFQPSVEAGERADFTRETLLPTVEGKAKRAALALRNGDFTQSPGLAYLTPDERDTFFSYIGRQDYDRAWDYLEIVSWEANAREKGERAGEEQALAQEHPWAAAVGSAVNSYLQPAAFAANLGQAGKNLVTGEYEPTDPNSQWFSGAHGVQNTAAGVHAAAVEWGEAHLGEGGGEAAGFLADTGLSILQNLAQMPFGEPAALILMSASAAGGQTFSDLQAGATPGQAALSASLVGATEYVTEKLPIDNIFRLARTAPANLRQFVVELVKQMGSEALGEMSAEVIENAVNYCVYDGTGISDFEQLVGQLVAEGMSEEEAKKAAFYQIGVVNVGLAGLGGAISGGVFGAGAQAVGYVGGKARTNEVLRSATEYLAQEGKVSNAVAEAVLADAGAVETLAREAGLALDDNMSQSQRRKAVKEAVETFARPGTDTAAPAQGEGVAWAEKGYQDGRRTREEVDFDLGRVERAVTHLGESGKRGFRAAYTRKVAQRYSLDWAYEGYAQTYNAALQGKELTREKARRAKELPGELILAARNAGVNDARSTLEAGKRAVREARVFGKNEAGLVRDGYTESLDRAAAGEIDRVAKMLGLKVQFAEAVEGGTANGKIEGGIVTLERNNENPVRALFGHEITHRIQELAPESYRAFRDAAMETLGGVDSRLEGKQSLYETVGKTLNSEAAMDELAADYAGRLVEDGDLLGRFIEEHQENRGLLRRLWDAVRDLAAKLTGRYKAQAQSAEALLRRAVGDAAQTAGKLGTQNAAGETGGGVKYSIKFDENGAIAVLDGKFDSDRKAVLVYLQGLVSNEVFSTVLSDAQPVYIGKDLPGEYTQSEYTKALFERMREVKFKAAGTLGDMLLIADNVGWGEDKGGKHGSKAKNGWYYYTTRFAIPVFQQKNIVDHYNTYTAQLIVRNDADGKAYLYDLKEIQKESSGIAADGFTEPTIYTRAPSGDDSISQTGEEINPRFSLKGETELDAAVGKLLERAERDGLTQEQVKAETRRLVEETYQKMARRYGAIAPGEKAAREVQVPRKTSENLRVSQTVRTVMEAQATPEEALPSIQELVAREEFSYERYSDKKAMEDAAGQIRDKGYAGALLDWSEAVREGVVSKASTAMGWALYDAAANAGDMKGAMSVLTAMVGHQRNAAQAVQATRILKRMAPDAQLYAAQRSVQNLQEEMKKRYGDKAPNLEINEALADRFRRAETQEARDEALRDIYRDIGHQMPSRFVDKWNAWRYLAMLGNPRTHGRNITGNAVFAPVVAAKDMLATGIESVTGKVSGGKLERTKGMVGLGAADRALLSSAWGDYANVRDEALGGGKYSDFANANQYVEEGRTVFKTKALEALRKKNGAALDLEDVWFSKPHYAYALAQYCKANGITAQQVEKGTGAALEKARAYAVREAQKATYRDTNAFSQTVSGLGRYQGSNPAKKAGSLILEGILPFRKTPANILVRGVEYSPIGLLKGLTYDLYQVRKGKMKGAEAIDHISSGLTGTGLAALGLLLASLGLVRGHGGDDKKEKEFEELQGHQSYALELPDGSSVTLDWLAPESIPFFVGVNLWETTRGEGEQVDMSAVLRALSTVSEPLLEMSCLQSISDALDSLSYASSEELNPVVAVLASAATSYLTQAVPTLLGQAERTAQEVRMTTYAEKGAFLTPDMERTLGKVSAKVPGWDYGQIPYIDAWGRTEASGGVMERAAGNFLNPAFTSTVETSPMEEELLRLYEATGEGGVLPGRAAKYFMVDGERRDLTAEEYVKYAAAKGQTAYRLLENITASEWYRALDDADKAEVVADAYVYANAAAKAEVSDYQPNGWVAKAIQAAKVTNVQAEVYIQAYEAQKGIESLKDRDGETISNSKGLLIMQAVYEIPGLSDRQRKQLFSDFGVGKTILHYNRALVEETLRKMGR